MGQDTQNVVVVRTSDADMALAVNTCGAAGRISGCGRRRVLASVRLPIAGIMTDIPSPIKTRSSQVRCCIGFFGCTLTNPFLTLSLQIALAVIPELRITNRV